MHSAHLDTSFAVIHPLRRFAPGVLSHVLLHFLLLHSCVLVIMLLRPFSLRILLSLDARAFPSLKLLSVGWRGWRGVYGATSAVVSDTCPGSKLPPQPLLSPCSQGARSSCIVSVSGTDCPAEPWAGRMTSVG